MTELLNTLTPAVKVTSVKTDTLASKPTVFDYQAAEDLQGSFVSDED